MTHPPASPRLSRRRSKTASSGCWNPYAIDTADPGQLVAWTLRNRVGIALATAAILSLAFVRASRRERMLS